MKIKQLLILVLSFWTLSLFAQSYSFKASMGTYEHLDSSISLNNGIVWDDPQFAIPIGFDFNYGGQTFKEIFLEDFGLGGLVSSDTSERGIVPVIVVYGADIIDRGYDLVGDTMTSQSNISYQLVGTMGDRILKIEWNNVGFFEDIGENNISSDYTNFQLWLHEGTNDIEMHFGRTSILQPEISYEGEPGPYIGLYPYFDTEEDTLAGTAYMLEGDPIAPTLNAITSFDEATYITGTIPEGTIYRFSAVTTSTNDAIRLLPFSIAPNPANNSIRLLSEEPLTTIAHIQILTISGQVVKRFMPTIRELNIADLKSGIYAVQLITEGGGSVLKKFVKK